MATNQNFEVEIAALAEAIKKEQALANISSATKSQKERVHLALREQISEFLPSASANATTASSDDDKQKQQIKKTPVGSKSYLDTVDDATVAKVNEYVAKIFQNGIKATLRKVVDEDPFLLDVFHDALADKLFDELKNRGLVK